MLNWRWRAQMSGGSRAMPPEAYERRTDEDMNDLGACGAGVDGSPWAVL